jgi:hypothetical protein
MRGVSSTQLYTHVFKGAEIIEAYIVIFEESTNPPEIQLLSI